MLRVSLRRGLETPEESTSHPQDVRLTLYTLPDLARAAQAERISLYMNGRLYSDSSRSSLERHRNGQRKVDGDSGEGATMADTRQAEVNRP
jgi:hypothetical protein